MRTVLFLLIPVVFGVALPSRLPAQATSLVQGRVLSRSGDVPLRHLELCLYPLSGATGQAPVESRQDGSFAFASVPAGRYLVLEEGECVGYGRASMFGAKQDPEHDYPDRLLDVLPGQSSVPMVIHLNVGAILQGRLLAPNQKPVAFWQVTAFRVTSGKAPRASFGPARILPHRTARIRFFGSVRESTCWPQKRKIRRQEVRPCL